MKLKDFFEFVASYPQAYPRRDRLKSSLPETPIPPSRRDPSGRARADRDHLAHAINMAEAGRRLDHKKPGKHPFSNAWTAAAEAGPA